MSEQYEWLLFQVLGDTLRLVIISVWIIIVALTYRATREFWRGFKEWERENYPDA